MSTKRKAENLLFVDVSMDPKYTSKVWEHLKIEKIYQCPGLFKACFSKRGTRRKR